MKLLHITSHIFMLTAACMLCHAEVENDTHGDHAHQHAEGEHDAHGDHAHPHAEGEHDAHGDHAHPHAEGEHYAHGDHAHPHGEHGHDHRGAQPIIVTADARARDLVNMRIETVPQTSAVLVHSVYGYLGSQNHALQTYALPCSGRITMQVKSAQKVKQGDLLYTLQSPPIADLQAEIIRINAAINRCETEITTLDARVKELSIVGTRNKDLEVEMANKKAELEQLRQEITAQQMRLSMLTLGGNLVQQGHLAVLEIRAEADGIVRNVGITQGSWGEQGAPVLSMSHAQKMEIATSLYGSAVPAFTKIRATIPSGRECVAVEGTWRLAEETDKTTHTRELFFTPTSIPAGVQSGQLCRLDLYTEGESHGMVSIPDTAVVKVGVDDVVFVQVAEGQFAMIKVHAGTSRRGMTPVSGLTPGQKIVVRGGYELKYLIPGDGQQKKAGHFHADGKFHEGDEH